MSLADSTRAAIEGDRLEIHSRFFYISRPVVINGERRTSFDIKETCVGIIKKENVPKTYRYRDYAFLSLGDELRGKWMWGFTNQRKINPGGGGPASSGKHPYQFAEIDGDCFLEIINGHRGDPLLQYPKNTLVDKL